MKNSVDVSIIVVSFNTRQMTLDCLRSIVDETTEISFEVQVIDNCSSDESFHAIEEEFGSDPRFSIQQAAKNLGFAAANNLLAKSSSGEYVLLLNPDTVVIDDAILRLIRFAEDNPSNGIWGGRTLFSDGTLNTTNCWGPFTVWSELCASVGLRALFPRSEFFHPRGYGTWQRDTVREVGVVTGCFFLMRRIDWERFRGLDPEFFMYGEETDLCMRAIKEGMRPIITPDATIIHHGGASETVALDKKIRLLDGQIRLFRRHFSPLGFQVVYQATRIGIVARALVSELTRRLRRNGSENFWANVWYRRAEWTRGARV
ncbi:MAG: glycosyltransferase family 2 protein [Actinomycetales bacterium]|nr:glycosyltransferase family 2 protein [Actinomycetales bacterium]